MNASDEINTKQLALRLATLDHASRNMLLAELPILKRNELQDLIHELEPLQAYFPTFELAMAEFEMDALPKPRSFGENRLQQLLSGESFAIKQQLIDVLARNRKGLVTPHVQAVVADYLQKRSSVLPDHMAATKPVKPWWKVWS